MLAIYEDTFELHTLILCNSNYYFLERDFRYDKKLIIITLLST